jgi:ATPase subunit of ABC transporter with duplicated ATPase domains
VKRSDESDKFIRHFQLDQTEQLAGRAARTERALDRLEVVDAPRRRWELRLTIPMTGRSGDRVAWASAAVVQRGEFRLGPVDLQIDCGDRVAIVGANGSGKSTLIDVLLGRAELVAGSAGLGPSVRVGEIEQARHQIASTVPLVRAVTDLTGMETGAARTLLAKFELVADHVERPASTLSPGERTRAVLALLMATGANLVVLDEPTNHLDIEAIEQLESALDAFDGTVLLVTHDRTLLDHFRATRILGVTSGAVTELPVPPDQPLR